MSSSSSPCAACKFLRRKCIQECVFSPYFPADQPQRFSNVHKVFGASNVAKLLNELPPEQREDAVNSLAYEAEARLRDPVYGCVGMISFLQQRLKQIQGEVYSAKKELATYIGPSALLPMIQSAFVNQASASGAANPMQQQFNMGPFMAIPTGPSSLPGPSHAGPSHVPGDGSGAAACGSQLVIREQHQQQFLEAQQLAALAVRDDQDIFQSWEQEQPQQQQFMRFHGSNGGGYDGIMAAAGGCGGGFNQVGSTSAAALPSLALGATPSSDQTGYDHHQIQATQQQQQDGSLGQLLFLQQPATPQQEIGQEITQHHEHNNQQQQQQQQQQGSTSQSNHQNLLLQLDHQHHEHIQQPQLQLQQQPQEDGIE